MKLIAKLFLIISVLILVGCKSDEPTIEIIKLCNGSETLCDKKYNEVVFACTHNAYNYPTEPSNFILTNQGQSIKQQLNNCVRAFMLDVYYENDETKNIWMYHGTSLAGHSNLVAELAVIENFLNENPTEIITLILECYIEFPDFKNAIVQSGLEAYLYQPSINKEWPTLQKMIDDNQRLVILSDVEDTTADAWYIYVWDAAFETHYSNKSRADFSCNINRGNSRNDLFIFNHFITQAVLGTGLIDSATVINQYDYLLNRLKQCEAQNNQIPNFVTVDFYEKGDVIEVVKYFNEL